MVKKHLGELLVEAGIITLKQLNEALEDQKLSKERLGKVLSRLGYINMDVLADFLCKQHGTLTINPCVELIDEEAVKLIPEDVARKYKVIPIKLEEKTKKLIVCMADPSNFEVVDFLKFITGYNVEPAFIMEESLWWFIDNCYHKSWKLK